MFSSTLKHYEENYINRLSDYKNTYEDYDVTDFLKNDIEYYTNYYNSLKKISDFIKTFPKHSSRIYPIMNDVVSDLKNINESIYNEIISLKEANPATLIGEQKVKLPPSENPPLIEIDIKSLNNRIKSGKLILKCINNKIENPQDSDIPEKQKGGTVNEEDKSGKEEDSKDLAENDYTKSTIDEYLENIKDDINPDQYKTLVDALYHYFTKGKFPKLEHKIMFKRVNKKKVGWALKEVYMNLKTDKLSEEYLQFAKDNINLFENVKSNPENYMDSNLYSYFTTNPDK
ncbi:hypothetical protein GSB9_01937 [Flavobacteriaceae bacterium GSB9]|nr:hypothetical protein GSB9_01937 [Flavobacteriaceae bacterium GSB9]